MSANRFLSIEAARSAAQPKGSRWTILFGPYERYLGRIFLIAPQQFLLVTKHGDLAFDAHEVQEVEWVDNALVTDTERSYWPSDPFI